MFFRRRQRRLFRRQVSPALQQANQLLNNGKYAEAAAAFQRLAQEAEVPFPGRAPYLHFQAGRAALLAGQLDLAMTHSRRGLAMLASQRRYRRLRAAGDRLSAELKSRGHPAAAAELDALVRAGLVSAPALNMAAPSAKPHLPPHCPSCGAAVHPDELEWLDDLTAECAYCGSPLRAVS